MKLKELSGHIDAFTILKVYEAFYNFKNIKEIGEGFLSDVIKKYGEEESWEISAINRWAINLLILKDPNPEDHQDCCLTDRWVDEIESR